jgi:hypothetical protein
MDTIISESKKFKVTREYLKSVEEDSRNKIRVKLTDANDNLIHEYFEAGFSSPINQFVTIRGQEWWIGGRHYMLKLFVNCETGQVFDDPDKREFSNYYKHGSEFIWAGSVKVSPNGNYLIVVGCMWSFPYEWQLYDIRNLLEAREPPTIGGSSTLLQSVDETRFAGGRSPNANEPNEDNDEDECFMVRRMSLYDNLRYKTFPEDDPRNKISENWLGDDEVFDYEFVSDNELTIKYIDEETKEWKYYNTIDLE